MVEIFWNLDKVHAGAASGREQTVKRTSIRNKQAPKAISWGQIAREDCTKSSPLSHRGSEQVPATLTDFQRIGATDGNPRRNSGNLGQHDL